MTVRFDPEAQEELRDAILYSQKRFGLGEEFAQAVEAAIEKIAQAPEQFKATGHEVRMFRMRRFPYYLFYHYLPASREITIYAVSHHHRQQDYWGYRLPEML